MNGLEKLTCLRFKRLLKISSWGSSFFIIWGMVREEWVCPPLSKAGRPSLTALVQLVGLECCIVQLHFINNESNRLFFISSMSQNSLSSFISNRICHLYCHCCPGFFQVFLSWDQKQNFICIIKKLV